MVYKNCCVNGKIVDIKTENGIITKIGEINEDGEDLKGLKVFSGLIDIHSHGCIGFDTMDGDKLIEMSDYLYKNGVTSWLPTTMTMDMETIKNVVNKPLVKTNTAQVLGFHLEGPYISKKHKGAQNERFVKKPDIEEFRQLSNIKIVTIAPEEEDALDFIEKCEAVVSIGHTDADYETSVKAIEKGAVCLTHTFNAMNGIHHREPGPVGAAIEKEIYAQVICDGIHIHKSVIKMLYKALGREKMILISDSMRATGLKDGEYEFGGQKITVSNSVARCENGAIAGSTSTLLDCVKKAIEFGISEEDAFYMASRTPAKLLGLNKGEIKVGFDADFIAVDDNYDVKCITTESGVIRV